MDHLYDIIGSLDAEEKREFQHFIQRNRPKKGRKDLGLFRIYCEDERMKKEDQMKRLEIKNKNAYYSCRKRLYSHLSDFALLKSNEEDDSHSSRVRGMLSISDHLFDRGLNSLAWNILKRADLMAKEKGLYNELNEALLKQIDRHHLRSGNELFLLISRFEENKKHLEQEQRLRFLHASLRDQFSMASAQQLDVDFKMIVQRMISQNGLDPQIVRNPRTLLTILKTIRATVQQTKEFDAFVNLATSMINGISDWSDHPSIAEILYLIAHAEYRMTHFESASETLVKIEEHAAKASKTYRKGVTLRNNILHAANNLLLGEVDESIFILTSLQGVKMNSKQEAIVRLNLSVYLFYQQDFRKARKEIAQMGRSDRWYKENFGPQWLMRQRMVDLLIQFECDDIEVFDTRMRAFERTFKKELNQKEAGTSREFVGLVKKIGKGTNYSSLAEEVGQLKVKWDLLPANQQELYDTMFYAWLKSKVESTSCYSALLQLVQNRPDR